MGSVGRFRFDLVARIDGAFFFGDDLLFQLFLCFGVVLGGCRDVSINPDALHELERERGVVPRAVAIRSVLKDRTAKAWRLGQLDVVADARLGQ